MAHGPGVSFLEFETGAGHAVQQGGGEGLEASGPTRASHPLFFPARLPKPGRRPVYFRDSGPCDDHAKGIEKNLSGMGNDQWGKVGEICLREESAKQGEGSGRHRTAFAMRVFKLRSIF